LFELLPAKPNASHQAIIGIEKEISFSTRHSVIVPNANDVRIDWESVCSADFVVKELPS